VLYLALLNQLLHSAGNVFDGHVQVDTMLVVEIDGVDLQAFERALTSLLDVLGPAVERVPLSSIGGIGFPAEFGSDDHFAAEGSKRFTDQLLIDERTVDFGGIEESNAAINGSVEQGNHLLLVFRRSIAKAHAHASESECRNFKIAFSEFAFLHCDSFLSLRMLRRKGGRALSRSCRFLA
jgi:hypothetical protein